MNSFDQLPHELAPDVAATVEARVTALAEQHPLCPGL